MGQGGNLSVSSAQFAVNLKLLQRSLLKTKHTWPSISLSSLGNEAPKFLIMDQHEFPDQQNRFYQSPHQLPNPVAEFQMGS